MALPHYSQDQTSRSGRQFEPVQANLFEVTILPPAGVEFLLPESEDSKAIWRNTMVRGRAH